MGTLYLDRRNLSLRLDGKLKIYLAVICIRIKNLFIIKSDINNCCTTTNL